MNILDVLNERQQVYAQLMDVRAKRREDGTFEDPLATQSIENLNKRFSDLTRTLHDLEVQERQAKEMVEREMEARERTNKTRTCQTRSFLTIRCFGAGPLRRLAKIRSMKTSVGCSKLVVRPRR